MDLLAWNIKRFRRSEIMSRDLDALLKILPKVLKG